MGRLSRAAPLLSPFHAGFDSPGKCLYTTIRELVENSLDAAESINVLSEIDIIMYGR